MKSGTTGGWLLIFIWDEITHAGMRTYGLMQVLTKSPRIPLEGFGHVEIK